MPEYNPYAAPQAVDPPPPAGRSIWGGVPQAWSLGDVVEVAWQSTKRAWRPILFAQVIALAFQYLPDLARGAAVGLQIIGEGSEADVAWNGVNTILGVLITAFFQAGLARVHLAAARGEVPELADVLRGGPRFLSMLGMSLLYNIAIALGLVLLVVPGIVAWIGFQFADLYIVDCGMGAITAMGASWNVTKGHRMALLTFNVAGVVIMLLGLLACGVGAIVALAVVRIAEAVIYLRISGRAAPPPGAPAPA